MINKQNNEQELYKQQLLTFKQKVNRLAYSDKKTTSSNVLSYDADTISKWINSPIRYEKELRNLSNFFYNTSAVYKLMIRYKALMPTYSYEVIPDDILEEYDAIKLKKQYFKAIKYVDKLNIPHEMIKAFTIAFREDYFYGYEFETSDSFFFQSLDANYCRVSSKEDGVYNFSFNFSYFDVYKDILPLYPEEFQTKYRISKNIKENWIELDPLKSICLKINEDIPYALPPFVTSFSSIVDLDEYKKIKKLRAKNNNFMALVQKIPINDKSDDINKFLIDLDTAMEFHEMAADSLPDSVGVITSPMDIQPIKTEKSKSDDDYVLQAYRELYSDGGVSQFLFNSDKSSSIGLSKSIMTDEEDVFALLKQFERWLNRKMKNQSGTYGFKVKMLNITIFNQKEKFDDLLKASQYGVPVKMAISSVLGYNPLETYNKLIIENDILQLQDKMIPTSSAHTQSSTNSSNGRPTKNPNDLADSSVVNIDNGTDANKQA